MDGFSVLTAYNGDDGLRIAEETPPDVILLDMMLPKTSGDIVMQKLHENPKTSLIPIIVLSNLTVQKHAQDSLQYGVKEYLAKAMYTPEQVVEKVKRYVS